MNPSILLIKGIISQLPEENRKKVEDTAEKLREMIKETPETALSMALVAFELEEQVK